MEYQRDGKRERVCWNGINNMNVLKINGKEKHWVKSLAQIKKCNEFSSFVKFV